MDGGVIKAVFFPMVSQKYERFIILVSTLRDRSNWYNTMVEKAFKGLINANVVYLTFLVCPYCMKRGIDECNHEMFPRWLDPASAEEMKAVASRESLEEMMGMAHGEGQPAFKKELLEPYLNSSLEVESYEGTMCIGYDPSAGGMSRDGMYAIGMINVDGVDTLVTLGYGCPQVTTTNAEDTCYSPKVLCEFIQDLIVRYGDRFNILLAVEGNMRLHLPNVQLEVKKQWWAHKVIWPKEGPLITKRAGRKLYSEKQLGFWKTQEFTVSTQFQWHTWMARGAVIAHNPVVFAGGVYASDPKELPYVIEEHSRQWRDFEEVPTKKGATFEGKRLGNDDIVCAALHAIAALCLIFKGKRQQEWRTARFTKRITRPRLVL